MVYDWADKEQECYRLYVEEKLPLDRVMEVLKDKDGFSASKRAFQTQFKRWDFPSKQNPAHKNAALVARVKELWETNTSQKEMLKILNEENFEIKERELMRVRAKNRWLLRVPNGTKLVGGTPKQEDISIGDKRKRADDEEAGDPDLREVEAAIAIENGVDLEQDDEPGRTPTRLSSEELSQEIQEKRQQRRMKLQMESEERWAAKKRRRRTRGWAGLPADPPGPPRFPSETTIDESKAYLHLSNDLYSQVRDKFQQICQDAGFIKKTIAGPEKWQAAKNRLIVESAHLDNEFNGIPNGVPTESKALALDVICTDVTKRMRTLERRMTIPEAKNALGINPEESRQIRDHFYNILKGDHFTSKLEAGEDHWKDLKQQWITSSPLLQDVMNLPDEDPQKQPKLKAIEVLCRDVMKRLRDDQTKRDPSRKRQFNTGPGPGPAPPNKAIPLMTLPTMHAPTAPMVRPAAPSSSGSGGGKKKRSTNNGASQSELQIDPSLLAAAAHPSLAIDQLQQYAAEGQNFISPNSSYHNPQAQTRPTPVFFQLNPNSSIQSPPSVWIGTLTSTSLAELKQMALRKHPHSSLAKIEGVVTNNNSIESLFPIDRDDELSAYLAYVSESGGKHTFSVHLEQP